MCNYYFTTFLSCFFRVCVKNEDNMRVQCAKYLPVRTGTGIFRLFIILSELLFKKTFSVKSIALFSMPLYAIFCYLFCIESYSRR